MSPFLLPNKEGLRFWPTSSVSFSQKHLFVLLLWDVMIVYLHLRFCHSLFMYSVCSLVVPTLEEAILTSVLKKNFKWPSILGQEGHSYSPKHSNLSYDQFGVRLEQSDTAPPFSLLAGEILILSAGFVLFSTVVFLGDLEIYFFVPVSGHWGSRKDGWTGGPGRQKGGQGRQRGGGQRACKHASHYYVHGTVAGQGELKSQKFSKATPPKMFRLTKINWFDPLTLTCMQAR